MVKLTQESLAELGPELYGASALYLMPVCLLLAHSSEGKQGILSIVKMRKRTWRICIRAADAGLKVGLKLSPTLPLLGLVALFMHHP